MVLIFTSKEAADNYNASSENDNPTVRLHDWARHKHAMYVLDPDQREYFSLKPFGDGVVDFSFDTKIVLPLAGAPRCVVEVIGRCLMAAVGEITYPESALKHATFGKVTLTAVIERDGSISQVAVKDSDVRPAEFKELLTSAATQNLKTWQFDSSDGETPFQIDYSYVMDTGPLAKGQESGQVTFIPKLPWNVEIRVKAPK